MLALLISLATLAQAPAVETPAPRRFAESQRHMGVEFEVVLYAADEATAKRAFAAAFERIAALDRILSDYDPASELSRLSETAPTPEPVQISADLWKVLSSAQTWSRQSDGAFDITIGPLTKLWRRARRNKELPTAEQLSFAREAVGNSYLQLDPQSRTAKLLRPNMRLDAGGIAKGFAADEALAAIRNLGITRALVRGSGDIAAGDAPPGETGWRVGLAPLNPDDPPQHFVRIANCAVSTSGDAHQHLEIDGRRYSHIIDPRSGYGVSGRSSVAIISPRGIDADALASAVSVLGPAKGLMLVEKTPEAAALIVHSKKDEPPKVFRSERFEQFSEPLRRP